MRQAPGSLQEAETEPPAPELQFDSASATFWPDVFVDSGLPWLRFAQSGAYHILALVLIWAGSRFLAMQPHPVSQPAFTHADVVYYTPSEYLPPLDTRRSTSTRARKADPEYSAQPTISVPPEADNHSQTIVTPPNIKLQRDVAMPNVVSLFEKMPGNPQMPIRPAPMVPASQISRLAPQMERAVIAPPPAVDTNSPRRVGDLDIGHSSVIAPAPQLPLDEQRTAGGRSTAMSKHSLQVVAPPPSLAASGHSRSGQGILALSLHPAVAAPPDPPVGNRRGNFAATPEGHRRASGAPATSAGNGKADGSGAGKNSGNLPSGLYVGNPAAKTSSAYSVNPRLLANARSPRMATDRTQPTNASKLSDVERAVFGDRKYYSLSLNMPNLNSAGGSWIIRFAALQKDSIPASRSSRAAAGGPRTDDSSSDDLSAPVATRKVDPAYPLELMRQNVGGTVILYGVIHTDGTVGSVRVLRGVDDRLAQFATEAITKWKFEPASKNGTPVDVEATFWIPFHPEKPNSNF